MNRVVLLVLTVVTSITSAAPQECSVSLSSNIWRACRDPSNPSTCVVSNATLPGTAFTALLNNGTFPMVTDPFRDDLLLSVPDIAVTGRDFWTLTWTTAAPSMPAACGVGLAEPHTTLLLRGINYRADVTIDGKRVGPQAAGMFQRFLFDIGPSASEVSIRVQPPDHPGNTSGACRVCGQGGNHDLAMDVTSQYTAGWDWIGGTPDRNTGVFEDVVVAVTGPVMLRDPHVVVTSLDMSVSPSMASGDVSFFIVVAKLNMATTALSGVLRVVIDEIGYDASMEVAVRVGGGWSDAVMPVYHSQVLLWWPHTVGDPVLYEATATFTVDGDTSPSHATTWNVGFRTVGSVVDASLGGRAFYVNGHRVYLEGGNWIATDQFNRYNGSPDRYYNEVRMHRDAGLNLIRLWGGSGGHGSSLFDAGDALGVLFMHEFWMSGDNNGRWAGNYTWPLDHTLYLAAAADTISLLRGHPSVLFYCGGNELYPLTVSPPPGVASGLISLLHSLDLSNRPYVASSMSNYTDPPYDPTLALAPKDGPYGILDERQFFGRNPGLHFENGTVFDFPIAFQPEVGASSCPEYASMQRFLSPTILASFPSENGTAVHPIWAYHRYEAFTDSQGVDHVWAYGTPSNTSEYALAAQLVQYRQTQALFEGYADNMGRYYTAVIMWKTQSPWPAFRGSLYDSYLATNGGFWGARVATQGRLKAQFNQLMRTVSVVHRGLRTVSGNFSVSVDVIDVSTGVTVTPSLIQHHLTGFAPGSVTRLPHVFAWPVGLKKETVLLYRVVLRKDSDATSVVSRTDYWLSNLEGNWTNTPQVYHALGRLRNDTARWVAVTGNMSGTGVLTVTAPSNATAVAFAVCVTVKDPSVTTPGHDTRVLPAWVSDNYFSLLPGEAKGIDIDVPRGTAGLVVHINGWNVRPIQIQMPN